jgi:hypothetical protein
MRRFTFECDQYSGIGVDWGKGRCTYRLAMDETHYYPPVTANVNDLEDQYGGLPGFSFDYLD